jgi:hypothetical protein
MRNGQPKYMNFRDRLALYAAIPANKCWEWAGATICGYGVANDPGGRFRVHRRAYELLVGPIPDGLHLDHLCRNRLCLNPSHLEVVTPGENNRRNAVLRTHCPEGHPLVPETMRSRVATGWRYCPICRNARKRAYKLRTGR